ncbi:MAG: extracellular solute-binding protein [Actinomycetota bacterium]|jgi:iron(III) transport system substrate-binding protein
MRSRLRFVAAATVMSVVTSLAAAGCSALGASDDEVVRVYSGRHYGIEAAFDKFGKDTGIKVQYLFGGDADLRERLRTEGDDTLADVYLTVDVANLALAAKADLLQPLESPALDKAIPPQYRDPQDRWFGLALRVRSIIYNPDKVNPSELSTYAGLGDPKWRGRLCLRNSTATYTQSLVASLIAHEGYDGAKKIVQSWVDNRPRWINSDPEIVKTVAAGGCDVAIVNHYYLVQEQVKNPDLKARMFWADQAGRGAHVNLSGAGVTKYADDPDLAQRFIEWLATDGQEIFISKSEEFPANPAVSPTEPVKALGQFKGDEIEAAKVGDLNADSIRLMNEVGYR